MAEAGWYSYSDIRKGVNMNRLYDDVIGLPDFSVSIKAWEKVKGRIINGSEDNIPFYVDGVIQCVEKGKMQKGYAATVV